MSLIAFYILYFGTALIFELRNAPNPLWKTTDEPYSKLQRLVMRSH